MDEFFDRGRWATVIGVVGDVHQRSLTRPEGPVAYFAALQRPARLAWGATIVRRSQGEAASLAPTLRAFVR